MQLTTNTFFITNDHINLFFHLNHYKWRHFIGCVALKFQVSIFDFYIIFLEDKVYVIRAYKDGKSTGYTGRIDAKTWTDICQRFNPLIPYVKELQKITDKIHSSYKQKASKLKHVDSFFDLITN